MTAYKYLPFAILAVLSQTAFADEPSVVLAHETINLTKGLDSLAFADSKKASDLTVSKDKLKHRSATLGNALSAENGIHSNPFGGGASAPVVRGQEGVRVKILQNGSSVADMSTVSPDHAIAVDTLLASRVEVVRGASTLLHANASTAGVINVIDGRIPSVMPSGVTGEALLRFNTGSDEKLATAGISFPVGDKVAMRVEGMKRNANPYNVPAINFGEVLDYLPDSYNNSTVGTVGLSYIGEQGHLGVSYSKRKDNYGLVGHNHKLDDCSGHVLESSNNWGPERTYLSPYPHLMGDDDVIVAKGLHVHCKLDYDKDPSHSHEHVYGHKHDHTQKGPWVDMSAKTFSLQGEIFDPMPSIDKIRLTASHSDYTHQEHDEGKHVDDPAKSLSGGKSFVQGETSYWGNKGLNAKLTVHQSPTERLSLVWGIDNQTNKTYALIPSHKERKNNRRLLVNNTQKTNGIFGLSEYKIGNVKLHTALRREKTSIPVQYHWDEIVSSFKLSDRPETPDLSTYQSTATSYALGAIWDITPQLRLDTTFSHNERTPTPMELYYHGKHLATNSFLYGNKDLHKEKSDNAELGLTFQGDKWRIKGSIYTNRFDNFIHPENLYKNGNLAMRRFTQSKAKLKGAELEIGYQVNDGLSVSVFGDVVRGRLYDFAPTTGKDLYKEYIDEDCDLSDDDDDYAYECIEYDYDDYLGKDTIHRPDRHPPRLSPDRVGVRINGEYGNFSPSLEYIRVSAQNRTSNSVASKYNSQCTHHQYRQRRLCPIYIQEDASAGYNLLNLGLDYHGHWGRTDYTWSIRANNLLNEKIYIHNSFLPFVPQQGRNVSLALSMNF